MLVAFNTDQDLYFMRHYRTADCKLVDVHCGWDPDYETGVYYAWFIWDCADTVLEALAAGPIDSTQQSHSVLREQLPLF